MISEKRIFFKSRLLSLRLPPRVVRTPPAPESLGSSISILSFVGVWVTSSAEVVLFGSFDMGGFLGGV